MAKLPGGGRRGAAVLCELIPDQLAEDPASQADPGYPQSPEGYPTNYQQPGYPGQSGYPSSNPGYPASQGGGYPGYPSPGYPSTGYGNDEDYDGGYPSYPGWR